MIRWRPFVWHVKHAYVFIQLVEAASRNATDFHNENDFASGSSARFDEIFFVGFGADFDTS